MLKIGFAQSSITPPGRVSLNGQYNIRVSEQPREPISTVAMAIGTGYQNMFWAACDLESVSLNLIDDVFALLKDVIPVERNNLILSATHIHTGPYLNDTISGLNGNHMIPDDCTSADDCRAAVAAGVAQALKDAYFARSNAYVETSQARVRTGVSRRIHYKNGSTAMYGNVATPEFVRQEIRDGGPIQIAYVRDRDTDALLGVIADVPCTAQVVESKHYISPDYFGVVRQEIDDAFGVPVLGIVGAAGDTSPHILLGNYPEKPNDREEDGREELGKLVAEAIIDHAEDHLNHYDGEFCKHAVRKVTLPVWQSTKEEKDAAEKWLNELRAEYGEDLNYEKMTAAGFGRKKGFGGTLAFSKALADVKRYSEEQQYFDINIHAIRIGNAAFITNPFELYIEYADRIRAAMRGVQIFDSELSCGTFGYLATPLGVRGGGYSATIFSGRTGPEGGEIVVKESIALLKELF